MSRTPDPRTRGATIADIIVAIGISLVSLGMAVPNLRAFAAPYSLDTATRVVAAEFSVARMRAIAQNRRHRINFDDGADTFALQAETAPGVFTDVGATRPMPDGISLGDVDNDPVFDTRGMLGQAIAIDVVSSHAYRTVSVNTLGEVEISDRVGGAPPTPQEAN